MQRLFSVTVRRLSTVSSSLSCFSCLTVQGRLGNGGVMTKSSSAICGRKTNWSSVCDVGRMARPRLYCAARRGQGAVGGSSQKYTWIEPQVEEEFVFLDLSEPGDTEAVEVPTGPPAQLDPPMAAERQMGKRGSKTSSTEMKHKVLELQVESIREVLAEEPDIEFHDLAYMSVRKAKAHVPNRVYGTPDTEVPFSSTCCSGCGAVMHCVDPHLPGYLPSEKYKSLTEEGTLHKAICQRCYLLVHHQKALSIQMSKEEYRNIVKEIHNKKALVLFIVDLLDVPDSIVSDLLDLVGKNKHIVVLGNKIDLLPGDSSSYLKRIKIQLLQYCTDVGISPTSGIKDVHLISAKTGYGIENLISSLQSSWKYKGDVYLVGTANAGKSTLFNTLLESDYCKSKASDVIHKATISPWPGTTLNLLKFPIINPTPYRMFRRQERLQRIAAQTEEDMSPEKLRRIQHNSKQGYLVGHVGRTFRQDTELHRITDVDFDPDELSFEAKEEDVENRRRKHSKPDKTVEFTYNELKDAHWLHDTPGIMKEHDILSLLTEQELKMVVPKHAIVPRTFVLKPGMVLFLGALGRIDYLKGEKSCWFSVVVSNLIPVHITSLEKADEIYSKHAGKTLLKVPSGGEERMKDFPPLIPQDFELNGHGDYEAVADIKFSSAGWVAVTTQENGQLHIRVHAPQGAGLSLRVPPLLPHIVNLKGERIRKTPAYKPMKPQVLVDNSLSVKVAQQLNLRKRK